MPFGKVFVYGTTIVYKTTEGYIWSFADKNGSYVYSNEITEIFDVVLNNNTILVVGRSCVAPNTGLHIYYGLNEDDAVNALDAFRGFMAEHIRLPVFVYGGTKVYKTKGGYISIFLGGDGTIACGLEIIEIFDIIMTDKNICVIGKVFNSPIMSSLIHYDSQPGKLADALVAFKYGMADHPLISPVFEYETTKIYKTPRGGYIFTYISDGERIHTYELTNIVHVYILVDKVAAVGSATGIPGTAWVIHHEPVQAKVELALKAFENFFDDSMRDYDE